MLQSARDVHWNYYDVNWTKHWGVWPCGRVCVGAFPGSLWAPWSGGNCVRLCSGEALHYLSTFGEIREAELSSGCSRAPLNHNVSKIQISSRSVEKREEHWGGMWHVEVVSLFCLDLWLYSFCEPSASNSQAFLPKPVMMLCSKD